MLTFADFVGIATAVCVGVGVADIMRKRLERSERIFRIFKLGEWPSDAPVILLKDIRDAQGRIVEAIDKLRDTTARLVPRV